MKEKKKDFCCFFSPEIAEMHHVRTSLDVEYGLKFGHVVEVARMESIVEFEAETQEVVDTGQLDTS